MKLRITLSLIIILILLIFAGSAIYLHTRVPNVNFTPIVADTFSNKIRISYIAHVTTSSKYCGKILQTKAVIYHRRDEEKIEQQGSRKYPVWSITRGDHSYTFIANENTLLISDTSRLISEKQRKKLFLENYEARYAGMDEVAGRRTWVVNLIARRRERPAKKLWIDLKTYVILRSIDYSSTGDERSRTQISKIIYNPVFDPAKFVLPESKSIERITVCKSSNPTALFGSLGFNVIRPRYVPSGYRLEGYHLFNSRCACKHLTAQLTYTDGLNVISVFESPIMTACAESCNMRGSGHGGCDVGGCEIACTGSVVRKDKTVVVVGDLLPDEIKKIAKSVD